mmetsp:Transcript_16404/g.18907  ORF Transcript_16404/g.18907 Transcript_16404/m.18907 type:complete len:96 (+) Transcript_16404:711-998(+)
MCCRHLKHWLVLYMTVHWHMQGLLTNPVLKAYKTPACLLTEELLSWVMEMVLMQQAIVMMHLVVVVSVSVESLIGKEGCYCIEKNDIKAKYDEEK